MQLGCNTVIFGMHPLEVALQNIARVGYSGAHLAALPGMANHLTVESDAKQIAEQVRGYGLRVSGIEAATDVSQPENATRLRRIMELAHDLEAPVVAIGSAGKTGDEESYKRFIEAVRPLAARAHELGIRLALKGHVGQAVYNTETMLRAINDVGRDGFGVNADPSHLYRADEDPHESVQRLGDAIVLVHIRDCPHREQPPGTPEQQVPGRGAIDLPAFLRALQTGGFAGPLDLEIIGAHKYDELARCTAIAAESRGYLHRCIQEVSRS